MSDHKISRPQRLSKVRRSLGTVVFLAAIIVSVAVYPLELNESLGISGFLADGSKLNGPNDITMLIRALFGMVVGAVGCVIVWKVIGKLFPSSVLGTSEF